MVSILLVIGVGTYFYQQSCEQKEQTAKSELYQIQKTIESEAATLSEAEKTPGTKLDVDAKFPKSISELNKMISSATAPALVKIEAGMKLGTMYLEYGKDDSLPKAIEVFKKVSELGKTSLQKSTAFYLLGTAEEHSNLLKEATDSYQKALTQNYEGLKGEILLSLVRVSMKANNPAQAKTFADQLSKEAPGSRATEAAQKLISKS